MPLYLYPKILFAMWLDFLFENNFSRKFFEPTNINDTVAYDPK